MSVTNDVINLRAWYIWAGEDGHTLDREYRREVIYNVLVNLFSALAVSQEDQVVCCLIHPTMKQPRVLTFCHADCLELPLRSLSGS